LALNLERTVNVEGNYPRNLRDRPAVYELLDHERPFDAVDILVTLQKLRLSEDRFERGGEVNTYGTQEVS